MTAIKDRGRLTFIKRLVSLSSNTDLTEQNYDKSLSEWQLSKVYHTEKGDKCICGQNLKNICVIYNKTTKNTCIVGTDCAEKILYQDFNHYFSFKTAKTFYKEFHQIPENFLYKNLSSFEIKFMTDITSKLSAPYISRDTGRISHYTLSDKQKNFYNKTKTKIIADTSLNFKLFQDFNLYSDEMLKQLLEITKASKFTNALDPVSLSFLVYKDCITKEEYNEYYRQAIHSYSKYYYLTIEKNEAFLKLLEEEIEKL